MGRGKRGKLPKMTEKDKLAKRVRNEQRKRVPSAVRWEKDHVKRQGFRPPPRQKTKRALREDEVRKAIAAAVEHAANDGMIEEGTDA